MISFELNGSLFCEDLEWEQLIQPGSTEDTKGIVGGRQMN